MCAAASGSTLIGDLGGTNARFARLPESGTEYSDVLELECDDFPSAELAIEHYLECTGGERPGALCLAVAAPLAGQTARFLNNRWTIDASTLARQFEGAEVRLVNDFQAIAHAVPALGEADVEAIGKRRPLLPVSGDFTIGLIGPGTGLGVSGLIRRGGQLCALASEGGHLGFAPENGLQAELLARLRKRFERVSNERLLSGPGISNIYRTLLEIFDQEPVERDPAAILGRARDGSDRVALETERLFYEILGQVAGNLALTIGAHEGVYLAGGIVRRYPERLQASTFREGFERKGRHRAMMERIPTGLITYAHPGLLGAAVLADHRRPA